MEEGINIQGVKKSEFKSAKEVLGGDFQIEELPEGVRLYLKDKAFDIGTKKLVVNIYRLIDDGGLKNKKAWVGKIQNRKPDESEIAEQYGPGEYIWIGKWLSIDGQERGVVSDVILISEDSRAAFEAYHSKQKNLALEKPAAPVPAPAFGVVEILKMMDAADEKALARMERITAMMNVGRSESAGDVLAKAYQAASEMMQKSVQTNLDMVKSVNKANQLSLTNPASNDSAPSNEKDDTNDSPGLPAWLAPFMPHISAGLGKLLEGGPMAHAVKTLILTSDEWKTVFNDPEKWGQAVAAMETQFGDERTAKALDILLNRKKGKK